jgi:hypothetical protein
VVIIQSLALDAGGNNLARPRLGDSNFGYSNFESLDEDWTQPSPVRPSLTFRQRRLPSLGSW